MENTFEQWLDAIEKLYEAAGLDFDRPYPEAPAEYQAYVKQFEECQTPEQHMDEVWEELENFHG